MRKLTLFAALAAISISLPACDAFGGGDPTLGGTYVGTDTSIDAETSLIIPSGTESDPDASFNVILREDGFADETETGVYDFPSLTVTGDFDFDCTVEGDGATLDCVVNELPIVFRR